MYHPYQKLVEAPGATIRRNMVHSIQAKIKCRTGKMQLSAENQITKNFTTLATMAVFAPILAAMTH